MWCDPLKHLAPRKDGAIWRAGNSLHPGSYRSLLPE
nr:MAG TPA: hypothetical protein [Caudoviricetes sp.]